jgi:hypothetical protein
VTERDSDFEFDFFEEPATKEAQPRERSLRRPLGGPREPRDPGDPGGPRRPLRPAAGFTPLLRLIGLIAFAILIVVLLVLWVGSCQEDQRQDAYREYMASMTTIADESQRIGRDLNDTLTTPSITPAELQTQLAGLANQQRLGANRARALDPPGPLRDEHESALEALQFRINGLAGLGAGFRRTADTQDAQAAGALLAAQAQRLVASDVIWDDLFKEPARIELRSQDITGVEVPDSNFVQTPDLASVSSMVPIWERINGGGAGTGGTDTGGPLHGTNIQTVTVQPSGQQLTEGTETAIVASTDLAFAVVVENSGDNQEVSIDVTLTIQQSPTPVTKVQTIDLINPGETETLTFRNFPSLEFGAPQTLRVDVAPVPEESNTGNNSAEYRVSFSVE